MSVMCLSDGSHWPATTAEYQKKKKKVLPEPDGPWGSADLHVYGASVSHSAPVYSPAFAGTHCAYP